MKTLNAIGQAICLLLVINLWWVVPGSILAGTVLAAVMIARGL